MNQYAMQVTLNAQNIFNSAHWKGIDRELRKRKVAEYLRNIICSYVQYRTLAIGQNEDMEMTCGVPQGSVLGPTLGNIYSG